MSAPSATTTLHGTAVAWSGRAVLIVGPSGSGKSALALALMAFGASLVGDDGVVLTMRGGTLWLSAPGPIAGLIEARGIGLLNAEAETEARLILVVDLAEVETQRLPPARTTTLLGRDVPLVHKVESAHFAPAILQYLKAGRSDA